jgi:outer membrane protein assembly factor BamB
VPILPNVAAAYATPGSQWAQGYTFYNDDGTLMSLTGKTFEFVVRPNTSDTTEPAQISVSSTTANSQGYITVTLATSSILVVLSPAATNLLGASNRPYALWMDPGQTDATAMVVGIMNSQLVAAA